MEPKSKGREHGEAVRKATGFAAGPAVATAKDVALNAQRGRGYLIGFVQGVLRPRNEEALRVLPRETLHLRSYQLKRPKVALLDVALRAAAAELARQIARRWLRILLLRK